MREDGLRLLFTPPASGPRNMAIDAALLASVAARRSLPVLRLYRWLGPWVSIGYAQRPEEAVALEACETAAVGVVRRATGGKAVLHGRDLTYCLLLPKDHDLARRGIVRSYLAISEILVRALKLVGVEAQLGCRDSGRGRAVRSCFEEHRIESVTVEGRKLIGSAQARREGGLLQHGSIALDYDHPLAARLFAPAGTPPATYERMHRARLIALAEAAPAVALERLAAALVAAFSAALGPAEASEMTADESAVAGG